MAENAPPDPGGYLEEFYFGPTVWHSDSGKDLYGAAAIDKFNEYASDPKPGGSDESLRSKGKR